MSLASRYYSIPRDSELKFVTKSVEFALESL
jgi:hypothetical protein